MLAFLYVAVGPFFITAGWMGESTLKLSFSFILLLYGINNCYYYIDNNDPTYKCMA